MDRQKLVVLPTLDACAALFVSLAAQHAVHAFSGLACLW